MGPFCVRHCDLGSKPNSTNPFTKGKFSAVISYWFALGVRWDFVVRDHQRAPDYKKGFWNFKPSVSKLTMKLYGAILVFCCMDAKVLVCSIPQMDPNQNVRDHSYIQISGRTCICELLVVEASPSNCRACTGLCCVRLAVCSSHTLSGS